MLFKKGTQMFKTLFSLVAVFALAGSAFAQSGDDYVRNTRTVPNVNQGEWVYNSANDVVRGVYVRETYRNDSQQLVAYVTVRNSPGLREELIMEFGSQNVGRAALKVGGRWCLGKGPFYDGSSKPENNLKEEQIKDSQGELTGVKFSLDTLEGPKSLVVNLP